MDQGVETLEAFYTEDNTASKKHFVNIGSLTRGSLSQDEVQRRPACAVISCSKSGVSIEVRRLKVKPAEEVFDVHKRRRQVARQMEMDSFVNKIKEDLQPKTDGQTFDDMLQELDISNAVKEKVLEYLEKV